MITLRASQDEQSIACAGSIALRNRTPQNLLNNAAAEMGTKVHELIAGHIRGEHVTVEGGREAKLFFTAVKIWKDVRPYFLGEVHVEEAVGYGALTGHCDIYSWCPEKRRLCVLDWKTGRVENEAEEQMLGYACRIILEHGYDPAEIFLFSTNVDAGVWEAKEVTLDRVVAHGDKLLANLRAAEGWDGESLNIFAKGRHCSRCSCSTVCPAMEQSLRSMSFAMKSGELLGLDSLTPEAIVEIRQFISAFKKRAEEFELALKARCDAEGGKISIGNGMAYKRITVNNKVLDPKLTFHTLREHLSDEEILRCYEPSWSSISDALKAKAKNSGYVIKHFLAEVETEMKESGAMTIKPVDQYREVKDVPEKGVKEIEQ